MTLRSNPEPTAGSQGRVSVPLPQRPLVHTPIPLGHELRVAPWRPRPRPALADRSVGMRRPKSFRKPVPGSPALTPLNPGSCAECASPDPRPQAVSPCGLVYQTPSSLRLSTRVCPRAPSSPPRPITRSQPPNGVGRCRATPGDCRSRNARRHPSPGKPYARASPNARSFHRFHLPRPPTSDRMRSVDHYGVRSWEGPHPRGRCGRPRVPPFAPGQARDGKAGSTHGSYVRESSA